MGLKETVKCFSKVTACKRDNGPSLLGNMYLSYERIGIIYGKNYILTIPLSKTKSYKQKYKFICDFTTE